MKSYLAFDLGASSGRGILGRIVDGKLVLDEIHRFKNYPYEKDGHFYWDYNSLLSEIKTGIQKAYAAEKDIVSLSIDTWGVDYVIFRDGKPVRDPYNYRDSRTQSAMERFHKEVMSKEELYSMTGIQLMVFNTLYQLYAHKTDHPEDFAPDCKALLMPDALIYSLTGEMSSEFSIASTTAMLDPHKRVWNGELLKKAGIPESLLAPVEMAAKRKFCLSETVAKELGVPRLGVVKAAGHDTGSAVASTPCDSSKKWAYISSGTWALLGTELEKPNVSPVAFQAHYTNEGSLDGHIRFLTNIMGTWLLQETKRVWNEAGNNIGFPEMSAMAKASPDKGLRFPVNDALFLAPCDMPSNIRKWFRENGKEVPETDAEVLRTIYDSLTDCFRDSINALQNLLGYRFDVLHILGGAIRDIFLMELTAKKTGLKVLTGPVEATATGNLIAQMIADGTLADNAAGRALVQASVEIKSY